MDLTAFVDIYAVSKGSPQNILYMRPLSQEKSQLVKGKAFTYLVRAKMIVSLNKKPVFVKTTSKFLHPDLLKMCSSGMLWVWKEDVTISVDRSVPLEKDSMHC